MENFDIRNHSGIVETINEILSSKGIAEIKIEKGTVPVVVEIKRQKRFPPKENK